MEAMQRKRTFEFKRSEVWRDKAPLVDPALEAELEAALLEVDDDDDDGVVDVGRGAVVESVVESVVVDGVSVEVPPVITDPVIGMGEVIRLGVETASRADEPDPGAEMVVIANCGLVLPESPITAILQILMTRYVEKSRK